jgi:hypothetical protein
MSRRKTRPRGELTTILSTYGISGEIRSSKRSVCIAQHGYPQELERESLLFS